MARRSYLQSAAPLAAVSIAALAITGAADSADAAKRRAASAPAIYENSISGPPVMAIVAIRDQRVSLYDANGGAIRARISSGRTGYESPVGVFSILQKNKDHHSNLYDDASMPFMQRLTWSGVALHAGQLPGYPASHGCVRLPYSFAEDIFSRTKLGMRVILVRDNVSPAAITHAQLPKPAPVSDVAIVSKTTYRSDDEETVNPFVPDLPDWPARQAELDQLKQVAAAKLAKANETVAVAIAAKKVLAEKMKPRLKAQRMLAAAEAAKKAAADKLARADRDMMTAKPSQRGKREDAKLKFAALAAAAEEKRFGLADVVANGEAEFRSAEKAYNDAEHVKNAAFAVAKLAERKTLPVSIFISRKMQTLYVRQGHEPVFEMPVTISQPEAPLGTFVYTAVDYADQGADLKWTAVSLMRGGNDRDARRGEPGLAPPATDIVQASAALDRVTIPPEAIQRIAGYVWPGSSLIVSDEAQSKETGKATDNVIVVSTEPQGALKTRPRQSAPVSLKRYYDDDGYSYGNSSYYRYDKYGRPQRYRPVQKPLFWW